VTGYVDGPPLSRAEVVEELAALGYQRPDAARMLREYYDETSARVGVRTDRWSLEASDAEAIASTYEWVHRDVGESLADARTRAASLAERYGEHAERGRWEGNPRLVETASRSAGVWASRARPPAENVPAAKAARAAARQAGQQPGAAAEQITEPGTAPNRNQQAEATAGAVAGPGTERGSGMFERFERAEFVNRIAGIGYDRESAEQIAREYVDGNTARHGVPDTGWRFDDYDLAEVARDYEWVDHHRGETLAQARERAAETARDWQRAEGDDRAGDPHYRDMAQRRAQEWASRAHDPNTERDGPIAGDAGTEAGQDRNGADRPGEVMAADELPSHELWLPDDLGAEHADCACCDGPPPEFFTDNTSGDRAEDRDVDGDDDFPAGGERGGRGPSWESIRAQARAAGVEHVETQPTLVLVDRASAAVNRAVAGVEHDRGGDAPTHPGYGSETGHAAEAGVAASGESEAAEVEADARDGAGWER
jgi:hypothetical protein